MRTFNFSWLFSWVFKFVSVAHIIYSTISALGAGFGQFPPAFLPRSVRCQLPPSSQVRGACGAPWAGLPARSAAGSDARPRLL